ncbi:hypothetical protein KKA14_05285 [bacterium]|nr:hypothetical protein [bacterium]
MSKEIQLFVILAKAGIFLPIPFIGRKAVIRDHGKWYFSRMYFTQSVGFAIVLSIEDIKYVS